VLLQRGDNKTAGGDKQKGSSLEKLARSIAAGKVFKMCAADADDTGEPPLYLSRDG
jgi:hypothetical protein